MTLAQALVAELAADPVALTELRALIGVSIQTPTRGRGAYTVATLAAELDLSQKTIRGTIWREELQAIKRGGRWIISAEAVDAWINAGTTARPPAATSAPRPARSKQRGVMKGALETLRDAR